MDYTLVKNQLYKKEGDPLYIARARVNGRVTKQQVITRLAHASSLTEGDINSVLSGLEKILIDYVVLGHSIDLGFLSIGYSIKGGFDSEDDSFRKDRNWVSINSSITSSFGVAVNQEVKPTKVIADSKSPMPIKLIKLSGDLKLPELQSGNLVQITGAKLAFNKTDTETGVYLQPDSGNPVRVDEYGKTGDTLILLKMPNDLTAGNNSVEVRVRSSDGKIVRGFLKDPVVIAA
ncbi:MAG: DUF4469 domain-containing protein [Spirochaetia bacterium]|nr:DUF4469 domain-containing protein [Spirochaetia bacterium]